MSDLTEIQTVQNAFSLLRLEGQHLLLINKEIDNLISGDGSCSLTYLKKDDAQITFRRHVETQTLGLDDIEVNKLYKQFMKSPHTKLYTQVAFHPKPQPSEVLNLYRPPSAKPSEGDSEILKDFIFEVICNSDNTNYGYLMRYLAHMIQRPEEKPQVAIILLGGQGTGKGSLYNLLKAIWGHTARQVHSIKEVLGNFNASALERSLLVFLDEAFFHGHKEPMDKFKGLITEPEITIEQKYKPAQVMKSFHRFFAASNHAHFGNIEKDDRRMFLLRVSDAWKGDHEKFTELHDSFGDGSTVSAFVYYLSNLDIDDWNPWSDRPRTSELIEQKLKSLEGVDEFLFECLQNAEVPSSRNRYDSSTPKTWNGELRVGTKNFKEAFVDYNKNAQKYKPVSLSQLHSDCIKRIPSAYKKQFREHSSSPKIRGIIFPSIHQSREEFEESIGGKGQIDWEDVPDDRV